MKIRAYAKINWTLDVVGRREDGYHLLDMLMQSVSLHDTLTIEPADGLSLQVDGGVPVSAGEDNLVLRAARALQESAGNAPGAALRLHKRIPVGAGLGGGSADAAAALRGLNAFWRLNRSPEALASLGQTLGADIPFCLRGGLCRAQGIGERLTPLAGRIYHLALIQPCRGLSTRQVFGLVDWTAIGTHPDTETAADALQNGQLRRIAPALGNALQPFSETLRPEIRQAIRALREHGARAALMTGSGSAVFGLFPSAASARAASDALARRYRFCCAVRTLTGEEI